MNSKQHILTTAVSLFSQQGFSAVSMRDIAKAVDMSTAGLYHHFPNKQALYLATVHCAFEKQASAFCQVWEADVDATEKLKLFIHCLTGVLLTDVEFRRLMQRELLDADSERMQLLAQQVFQEQFNQLIAVIEKISPTEHPHFMALSVLALVCDLVQLQPLSRYLPQWQPQYEQQDFIAEQVINLLMKGLT